MSDLIVLAATYVVAIAGNHAFIGGNKRAAFIALGLFLADNGLELETTNENAAEAMLRVAAGEWGIEPLTVWLRSLAHTA